MKKLLSILLTLVITVNSVTSDTFAIGYNKVVGNELGGITTFVGSENLEKYMQQLRDEMEQAKQNYEEKYVIHPWKGALAEWAPIFLAFAFNLSLNSAMKLYNRIKFKKAHPENTEIDTSLSILQTIVSAVSSVSTILWGRIKSRDYTELAQLLKADAIWRKNRDIIKDIKDAINDPDDTVRLYGAEIICHPRGFLDKINSDCAINSQEYYFNPNDEWYDPELAATIPRISA